MALTRKQKAIKNKWLKALRSGNYSQTRGVLFRAEQETRSDGEQLPAGYCCLGVLQHVIEGGVSCTISHDGSKSPRYMPPFEWYEKYGLKELMLKKISLDGDPTCLDGVLSRMNDVGSSFCEIADTIEEELV